MVKPKITKLPDGNEVYLYHLCDTCGDALTDWERKIPKLHKHKKPYWMHRGVPFGPDADEIAGDSE